MPVIKSAKKALRTSKKKRVKNIRLAKNIRIATKNLKQAIASNTDIKTAFAMAQKAIDKAYKGKYIKKNKASRKKAQLAKLINTK